MDVKTYSFAPSLYRYQILGLQSGSLTNWPIMLCIPLKAHSGETGCLLSLDHAFIVKYSILVVVLTWTLRPIFRYMAPEYFMHGIINEKTDVFAYGVLLLELVTGRKAVDSSRQSLVIWVQFSKLLLHTLLYINSGHFIRFDCVMLLSVIWPSFSSRREWKENKRWAA